MNVLTKKYRLVWDPASGLVTSGEFKLTTKTTTLYSVFEADTEEALNAKILDLGYEIPIEIIPGPLRDDDDDDDDE